MKTLLVRTLDQWRDWLTEHHASESEVWLIFHKRHTRVTSIDYKDALDEALCFGWVDSLVKRLDDRRYARKFTPLQVGMILYDLVNDASAELPLLAGDCKRVQLWRTIDRINARHGANAAFLAGAYHTRSCAPTRIAFNQIPDLELNA